MDTVRILATSIVGIVFLVAGAAKLVDRARWSADARELGVPAAVVPVVAVVPYVEIALGAGLVAQVAPRVLAAVALVLLAAFTVLIGRVLVAGRHPACACFGAWSSRPLGRGHVARNVALMAVCVVAVV